MNSTGADCVFGTVSDETSGHMVSMFQSIFSQSMRGSRPEYNVFFLFAWVEAGVQRVPFVAGYYEATSVAPCSRVATSAAFTQAGAASRSAALRRAEIILKTFGIAVPAGGKSRKSPCSKGRPPNVDPPRGGGGAGASFFWSVAELERGVEKAETPQLKNRSSDLSSSRNHLPSKIERRHRR